MNFEESKTNEYLSVYDKFDRLSANGEGIEESQWRKERSMVDRVHKYRWKSRDIPGGFAIPRLAGNSVIFCDINVPRDLKETYRLTMRNTKAETDFP